MMTIVRFAVLLLLSLYVIVGLLNAPFHADESQHIALSHDYAAYFVVGDPARLRVNPPVPIHSESYLRLLDGTVNAYITGFILWHAGQVTLEDWQTAWYFPDDPATNRAAGRYPPVNRLRWGRIASALFTAGSLWIIYQIGKLIQSPSAGMWMAALFAVHPIILLNGRRAMQEGALLFFSLMVVWLGLRLAEKPSFKNWAFWGLTCGLALASKPTAIITIIGVSLGLCLPSLLVLRSNNQQQKAPSFGRVVGMKGIAGLIMLLVFLILTPAIWSNPPARLWLAAQLRREALAGQTADSDDAYNNLGERTLAMLTMPFPANVQYYESDDFASDSALRYDIAQYDASWLRGIRLPAWLGMGLAAIGLWGLLTSRAKTIQPPVILAWVAATAAITLLTVPLAWQRYYLPYIVVIVVLAGLGLDICWRKGQSYALDIFGWTQPHAVHIH